MRSRFTLYDDVRGLATLRSLTITSRSRPERQYFTPCDNWRTRRGCSFGEQCLFLHLKLHLLQQQQKQ